MEYEEYMASLMEQVHDRRAKSLVAKEFKNHIEEQSEMYETEGMSHSEAVREAVRQMGNPVEVGIEMNKIHKPKMPWAMLSLVVVMMLASIIMQAVIFAEGAGEWGNLLPQSLIYNGIALAIILLLLYMDYNFIAKYAYQFYGVFMLGMPVIMWLFTGGTMWISGGVAAYYGIQMLFPLLFAGLIYKNRNRGSRGMATCLTLGGLEIVWYSIASELFGLYYNHNSNAAKAESVVIMLLMLAFAVWKGIFGRDRKRLTWFLLVVIGAMAIIGVLFFMCTAAMRAYIWARITNVFNGTENSYMNIMLQNSIAQAEWLGGQNFLLGIPNTETYTTFALNSVFTYFGKFAGVAVIAVYILFIGMAMRMSLKQSNRIGFLLGIACTVSILVRFAAYVAINVGCGLWWTTLVPFFSYGKISAVMNGVYIGLILCVYRNSNILQEENVSQRRFPRIRVTIE